MKSLISVFKLIYGGFWLLSIIGIFMEISSRHNVNAFTIVRLIAANIMLGSLLFFNGLNGLKNKEVKIIFLILESLLSIFYIIITTIALVNGAKYISQIVLFALLNGGLLLFMVFNFIQIINKRRKT